MEGLPPKQPILRGERLALRPTESADVERLLAILAEPEVERWWGSHDAARVRREIVEPGGATTGLAIEADGELIGALTYHEEPDPDYRHAELDIFLTTTLHGRGLGVEALRTVARHLFEERGHHRLEIVPAAANGRAIRAYERAGFQRVGVARAAERGRDGRWHDCLVMDMLVGDLAAAV